MGIFAFITAMRVAGDGISLSTVQNARLRTPLMAWCTWYMEMAPKRTYTVHVTSKECVRNYQRARCAWDSGSVIVMVTDLLTRTQAGTQCPGSTWKRYLLRKLKKEIVPLIL